MNIVYFGSPAISAILLTELLSQQNRSFNIPLVVTQKDKPVGKRLELTATPVKKVAVDNKIHVFDDDLKLNKELLLSYFKKYEINLCIVYAYGNYIQEELLNIPKFGFWNIHPSLLPLYRGPSPIAYPLMMGDITSGTSLIQLNNVLDGGPIILQKETILEENLLRSDLEHTLTLMSVDLILEAISKVQNSELLLTNQNEKAATQTRLLSKEDGYIDKNILEKALHNSSSTISDLPFIQKEYIQKNKLENRGLQTNLALAIFNLYRALTPWPGIWTNVIINGVEKRLKIIKMSFIKNQLFIDFVQLEGKKSVAFSQFNKAYNIFVK